MIFTEFTVFTVAAVIVRSTLPNTHSTCAATVFDMTARIEPDRAAMEIAHQLLATPMPLDEMLKKKEFELILKNVARRHMQRCMRVDMKKLQANNNDEREQ